MTLEEMKKVKEENNFDLEQLSDYTGVPFEILEKIFLADMVKEPPTYMASTEEKNDSEKKQGDYTLTDYYALPDERRVELIDGVIYDMGAPRTVHQDIVTEIHYELHRYIKKTGKACKVYESPIDVQLCCDQKTMVQPDIIVVCDRDKIKGFGIYGAPDFILEVLSDSTRKKDMTIKLAKYEEAGVREYWIIDPRKEILITYDFTDNEFLPCVHQLTECVPVAITEGKLVIDLTIVAESLKELRDLQ